MLYSLANLPYWILLGLGLVLFIVVMAAGGGDDDLDFSNDDWLNLDADAADSNTGFIPLLAWLGIGRTPLILLLATDLSLWGLLGWVGNVLLGLGLGVMPSRALGWGGVVFVGSFIGAVYLGSVISRPIAQLLAPFGQDASSDRLIGCEGIVTSAHLPKLSEGKVGQVDVTDAYHNLVTVSAALPHWATVTPRHGQTVLIIEQSQHGYVAIAKDSNDADRWLSQSNPIQDTRS
jgi:hypothetical protein